MIYQDRHGRWWCRMQSDVARIWAMARCPEEAVTDAISALKLNGSGDWVAVDGVVVGRRLPGQNPHEMVPHVL